MSAQKPNSLISGNAYRLFVDELSRHVENARKTFFMDQPPAQDDLIRARTDFHTIRGGAGFFGLDEIAKCAAEIEKACKEPLGQLAVQIDAVRDMILEIERLVSEAPVPLKNKE